MRECHGVSSGEIWNDYNDVSKSDCYINMEKG